MRKLSEKKIIKILKDAEQAFRKQPMHQDYNFCGLCLFIEQHPLIKDNQYDRITAYISKILGDKYQDYYTFTDGYSQKVAWTQEATKKLERSNFCAERLKEYK
jgi:hypothetical protein